MCVCVCVCDIFFFFRIIVWYRSHHKSFRPWNKSDFLDRVQTFSTSSWFAKPLCISPLQCARFGWVNVDFDMIECPACHVTQCFTISPVLEGEHLEKAAQEYAAQLPSSHKPTCPWNGSACPISLCQIPHVSAPLVIVREFKSRRSTMESLTSAFMLSPEFCSEVVCILICCCTGISSIACPVLTDCTCNSSIVTICLFSPLCIIMCSVICCRHF
jgi:C3HC zinc finger-like